MIEDRPWRPFVEQYNEIILVPEPLSVEERIQRLENSIPRVEITLEPIPQGSEPHPSFSRRPRRRSPSRIEILPSYAELERRTRIARGLPRKSINVCDRPVDDVRAFVSNDDYCERCLVNSFLR
jgi:hypothetical protein